MSLSINWSTKVISVPQSYLTYDTGSHYTMDIDQFRLDLKDIEDSEQGIVHDETHRHNTEVVLGDLTLARVVEIINGYTKSMVHWRENSRVHLLKVFLNDSAICAI